MRLLLGILLEFARNITNITRFTGIYYNVSDTVGKTIGDIS